MDLASASLKPSNTGADDLGNFHIPIAAALSTSGTIVTLPLLEAVNISNTTQ
jgi:hypothetical protein